LQVQVLLGAPEEEGNMKNKVETIRSIYLYLVSLVGVLMIVFGLISFVNQLLTILIPQGVTQGSVNYEFYYSIQGIAREITFVFLGIALFAYHWRLIVKEHRIGKRDAELEGESSMNFFEALFFYALSFIGIMVLSFSFASFVSNFFFVNDVSIKPLDPNANPSQILPTIAPNIRLIVQSGIASIIGLIVWLLSFAHIQNTYKKSLLDSKSINPD
jgi:uncharacterized membrane protein